MQIRRRNALALPLLLLPGAARAQVQGWASRPVRIVVSFTAGGTIDIIARLIGVQLERRWGQPVVIENRSGAGGNIGTDSVVKAAPDGYTLLVGSVGPLAVNVSLYRNMPYDPRRDLAAITQIAGVPNVLIVRSELPVHTVAELVAAARRRPGQLSYASTGSGTSSHLSGVMLDRMAEIETLHVPYRGAVALNDVLAGRVEFMFATIPSVIEQIRSRQLRALAVTSTERSRSLPAVPTMAESGFPEFDVLLVRRPGTGAHATRDREQDCRGRARDPA